MIKRFTIMALATALFASLIFPYAGSVPAGLPTIYGFGCADKQDPYAPDMPNRWKDGQGTTCWDYSYQYLVPGWATWSSPTGQWAVDELKYWEARGQIQVFTYYYSYGSRAWFQNSTNMTGYWRDLKTLFQVINANSTKKVIVHFEPDGIGFWRQANINPTSTGSVLVGSVSGASGVTEINGLPDSLQGWSLGIKRLRDTYAPNKALIAHHYTHWATGSDVFVTDVNSSTQSGCDSHVDNMTNYMLNIENGAANAFDLFFVDPSDRDAAWYDAFGAGGRWTADTWGGFASTRTWGRIGYIVNRVSTNLNRRGMMWQIPEGNEYYTTCNNSDGHYKDDHSREAFLRDGTGGPGYGYTSTTDATNGPGFWANHGIIATLFGSGYYGSKPPDGNNVTHVRDYKKDGITGNGPYSDDDGGYIRLGVARYCSVGKFPLPGATPPTPVGTNTRTPTTGPSPTRTPTFTISPTFSATPYICSVFIYDGDTVGMRLADGTVTAGTPGTITEVTGGIPGNAMRLNYVTPTAYWQAHKWVWPGGSKSIGDNTHLRFEIKATSGTVQNFLIVLSWASTTYQVDVSAYVPGGITTEWKTAVIPFTALIPNTVFSEINFIDNAEASYTVLVDNIRMTGGACPTDTPTITMTRTRTPTPQNSATYTRTATRTASPTFTTTNTVPPASSTYTRTGTPTYTSTRTATPTYTSTSIVPSATPTFTRTMTGTLTYTATRTATGTYTRTVLPSSTRTASPTYTVTPSISPTWTFGYGTHTITPTITFTGTRTASPSVTATSTRTNTVTAASATPTSTRTNTVPGTYTFTPTGTRTATASVVITSTNTPYQSPTMTYTAGACTCPGIFGSNTTGTYNYDVSGYFNSSRFELAEDAVASAINVNIGSTNGTARAMVAIYTNSVNRPDALVVEAGPYTVAAGWNNIAIPATPLTAGSYWLAIQFEPGAQLNFGYVPGGTTEYYYGPIAFGAFPVNADAGGYNDGGVYSMYVDYCPVVCGSPTPTRTASPTVTITPTYVGTCACEATTGKQYDATAGGNIMGWISMNWYGVAEEGNAQAISINVISGSGEVRVGLYADNGSGAPGILLSESQPTTVGPGWNRIEIGQAAVHAGNVYWLALQNGDNLVQVGREMGSMGDEVYVSYPYAAFPGAAPVMTAYSGLWDIKLHYCPVVCGATATETPANTNTPEPTFTATLIPTPTFTAIPGGSLVSVITAPLSAVVGSQITVIMNVSNNGSATIVNISPSTLTLSDPGAVSLVSGPQPGSISSLDAGASADFTWVYNVTAASASLTFGGNASGTHSITSETVTGPFTQSSGTACLNPTPTVTQTRTPTLTVTVTMTITPTQVNTPVTLVFENGGPVSRPNPSRPGAGITIRYDLNRSGDKAEIAIYTVNQRLIRKFEQASPVKGRNEIVIENEQIKGLASGIYYYTVTVYYGNKITRAKVEKIIILR